jgi:hypothetical protein
MHSTQKLALANNANATSTLNDNNNVLDLSALHMRHEEMHAVFDCLLRSTLVHCAPITALLPCLNAFSFMTRTLHCVVVMMLRCCTFSFTFYVVA